MITDSIVRYFALHPNRIISKHKAELSMDGDVCSILTNLKIFVFPNPAPSGKYVVCAEFPKYMVDDLLAFCQDYDPTITKVFSLAGRNVLQMNNSYIGATRKSVLDALPGLKGYVLDENGESTGQLKFPGMIWAFQIGTTII